MLLLLHRLLLVNLRLVRLQLLGEQLAKGELESDDAGVGFLGRVLGGGFTFATLWDGKGKAFEVGLGRDNPKS